jgi:hypothetical protein
MSQVPVDTFTIPSRRPGNVFKRQFHVPYRSSPTSGALPTKLLSTPPSSFPVRFFTPDRVSGLYDEANLSTVEDIRQEISAVEMEASRISEVFNDLELNASPSSQREHHFPSSGSTMQLPEERDDIVDPAWAVVPERRPHGHGQDSGGMSSLLIMSEAVSPSMTAFAYQGGDIRTKPKASASLLFRGNGLPLTMGLDIGGPSKDSIPSEMDIDGLSENVADIQKQRADVIGRYDARLDYLWAKLKSAELHERAMK